MERERTAMSRQKDMTYGPGKSSKHEKGAKRSTMIYIELDEVQVSKATSGAEGEESEMVEELDTDELVEALEFIFIGQDNSAEAASHSSEEDEESESVLEPFKDPVRVSRRAKKSRNAPVKINTTEEMEERPRSRWLITTCRCCGNMFRFRSDQSQPPTCGKPECIRKFEERNREKSA